LADLGNAVLPAGTSAVAVQKFNSTSAASDAIYIPFGFGSPPGHALAILNTPSVTWWTIHPDYVSLEAAGAPPAGPTNDCAAAMQRVLDYLAAVGQAKLQLWERDYVLQSCATLTQSNPTTDPLLYFTIQGRGRGVSRLMVQYVPTPANPPGAFAIVFSSNQSEFVARDFSVIATGATATNAGCGTAILANFPGSTSAPGHHRGAILEHIEVGNDNVETNGVSWSYFNVGIDISGAAHPLVFDCTVAGPAGPNESTCIENPDGTLVHCFRDESPQYLPAIALKLDESYGPYVAYCKFWHGQVGISYNNTVTAGAPQGFSLVRCEATGFKTGLLFRHLAKDPNGFIGECFLSFRDYGMDIHNIDKWQISGCEFFNEGDGYNVGGDGNMGTAYDMSFADANIVNITSCRFNEPAGVKRVHIELNLPTTTPPGTSADHFLIAHNQFGELGRTFGTSAVQVLGNASDIQIGHNDYIGAYSGPVVDDSSSAAVATLGYPSPSATSPSAIVPNGGATTVYPTLGSASVAWPATFNNAHYLPTSGTPSFPTLWDGWVLYTDTDGSLKAKAAATGHVVVLGTP
jgi:hypothetical protein